MAIFTAKRLSGPTVLTTSAVSQFSVAAGKSVVCKQFVISNTSASTASVTFHLVTSGGSPASGNAFVYQLSVAPNSSLIYAADIPLSANESIHALASAASAINLTITGIEIV